MSKQFWGVVVIVVLVFVGIFALTGNKSKSSSSSSGKGSVSQHIIGNTQSNVKLVEYGDYECPYCGQFYPVVKQVQTEFNNQISFQFSNFPLVSIHQNAFASARAAEAAGMQNKFWEMHDALYQTQNQWVSASDPTTFFNQIAQQLGLNVKKFQTDYASSQVNDTINADMAEGNKLNIQGTPTFFLNGKQIAVGQASTALGVFESLIKAEIAKQAGNSTSSTTTPAPTSTSQTKAN